MARIDLTNPAKGQYKPTRCKFLIGPMVSWFMPNTMDLWTQHKQLRLAVNQASTSTENVSQTGDIIGCFCYGEVHHHNNWQNGIQDNGSQAFRPKSDLYNFVSANVNQLVNISEDNSRVTCVRFLKNSKQPMLMVLTENGSLIIHDCIRNENSLHFKKKELLKIILGPNNDQNNEQQQDNKKKTKINMTKQINSFIWPDGNNIFLGISLVKEKKNLLVWLKTEDVTKDMLRKLESKENFIDSHEFINLDLSQYANPICCMESVKIDDKSLLISLAMDDGLIVVVNVNQMSGKVGRLIKLARHNDQICSMSFYYNPNKRYQSGLLASVSRDGLVLVWDVEDEYYFADYQASSSLGDNNKGAKINWFSLAFVSNRKDKLVSLAVSSTNNGLTFLEIPEKSRSKVRLKDNSDVGKTKNSGHQNAEQTLKHHALLFNIVYDPISSTMITSSLDGNFIFWSSDPKALQNNQKNNNNPSMKARYLMPAMQNNSRGHMIRHSPIREDFMGLALGKAGMKFYKIGNSSTSNRFDMSSSCCLVVRRITKASVSPTSLSWNPNNEYRLAVGTLEGKVLQIDMTPRKVSMIGSEESKLKGEDDFFGVEYEVPRSNDPQATDGVYSISWGPNPSNPEDISKLAIYAVGSVSHKLFIYTTQKETSEKLTNLLDEPQAQDVGLPEMVDKCSEVSWKSSLEFMALGTISGKIIVASLVSNKFVKVAIIEACMGTSNVQCLAWHPSQDSEDAQYYQLAASANESPAFVFDIRNHMLSRVHDELNGSSKGYVCKLDGHKKAISDIAWSPHEHNQLATCSFDRHCFVWTVPTSHQMSDQVGGDQVDKHQDGKILSGFLGRDRLFTLEWSLVDEDLLYTTGKDSTIWAWRPSENSLAETGS